MGRGLHKVLNTVLPMSVRERLRGLVGPFVPSLRHLDMPVRLRHLASLGFAPGVVFDIGAADGTWARMAHGVWPTARIVGFEPNRRERPALERTAAEVPGFAFKTCFLGPRRGEVEYVDNNTQTSLVDATPRGGVKQTSPMLVLDELVAAGEVPAPDFLKLDVQGYELEVLAGAEKVMAGAQGLMLEISLYRPSPGICIAEEVIAFMSARGFGWYDVMGIMRRRGDDALAQMDFFFLRRGHALWRESWE